MSNLYVNLGTPIIWGDAGATGVTNTLTLNALANGSARMGAAVDLGATTVNWFDEYLVELYVETGTAPVAGTSVDLYFACSRDNTNWPGKVTGSDGAYSSPTTNLRQLEGPVLTLVATADANTVLKQSPRIWRPRGRYVVPVLLNSLGQAIRNQGTASNNGSRVILTPRSLCTVVA